MMFVTAVCPGYESHRSALPKIVPCAHLHASAEGDRKDVDAPRFVVIVNDDPDLFDVTSFVIETEGMAVESARNGEEALALLRAGRIPPRVVGRYVRGDT